ncbi:MAG: FecR family protein, partial [Acidobacteriota bacterium]
MRERFHTLVMGAAVLAVSAFAPLAAQDDVSHVRIVRLSFIQGTVTLQPTGAGDRAARLYDPVQEGFLLRTHADSFAEVEFENGSTARLGEDSELFFEQLALASQTGGKLNRLSLRRGYATFNVDLAREDIFEVEAQGTEIELEESAEFRVDLDIPQTHIKVFDGRLFVEGPTGTVEVEADQTLTLNPDGEELIELRSGITEDAWDQWNRERDNLRVLQARGGTLGSAPYDDRHYDDGHVYSTRVYHDHHYYRDYPIYFGYPYSYGYPYHHGYYGHAYYPYRSGFGIHFGFNYGSPYRYAWTGLSWYPWHFSSHSAFHFSGHNRFRDFNRLRRTNFAVSPFVPPVNRRRLGSRVFLNRTLSGSSRIARGEGRGFGVRRTNFAGAGTVRTAAVTSVTPVFGGGDPNAPGPFAFGDADRVRGILEGAGFEDVALESCEESLRLG